MKRPAVVMSTASDKTLYAALPVLTQEQFNEVCKRSGIELGLISMVYNPAHRKHEIMKVPPDYWRNILAKGNLK